MNRAIKFEYVFTNHAPVVFTISEIEIGKVSNFVFREGLKVEYRRQYTGLKDRNGAEIYEGDKLEYDFFYNEFDMPDGTGYWEWRRTWGVVVFEDGMFKLEDDTPVPLDYVREINGIDMQEDYPYPEDWEGGFKVIGNIFEDEELAHAD